MSKEIKFRAWDYVREEILPITSMDWNAWWVSCEPILEGKVTPLEYGERNSFRNEGTDRHILMQYTGLKDKHGKEIYEGDILKQTYQAQSGHVYDGTDMSFCGHHIGEVVVIASKGVCLKKPLFYSEETDETSTSNQYKSVAGYRCEVIGNIYKNPELLEVAK